MSYHVYNVKTNKTWSLTFPNEKSAREAIKRGHNHLTDHLIISSYGGERKEIPFENSMNIASLFVTNDNALAALLQLKYERKYTGNSIPTLKRLQEFGLIESINSPKITELGDLVTTRLLIKMRNTDPSFLRGVM